MTGCFAIAARASICVSLDCKHSIAPGDQVYLWHKLERQAICLSCAKARWGYTPDQAAPVTSQATERASLGFDSTKSILRALQAKANARDPKLRQAGER